MGRRNHVNKVKPAHPGGSEAAVSNDGRREDSHAIARRIALYVVTAVVAITINFFLPRLMPGNPALAVLGKYTLLHLTPAS